MKTLKENIREINRLALNMPKTINEALNYNNEMPADYGDEEEMSDAIPGEDVPTQEQPINNEPQDVESETPTPNEEGSEDSLNVEQFVDDIRKKSLRGMAQLAENPDDERYQLLKKI